MKGFSKSSAGFGLIEILVAVFIVSLGVLAVTRLQLDVIGSGALNRERNEALSIAQDRLEELRDYANQKDSTGAALDADTFLSEYIVDGATVTLNRPVSHPKTSYIRSEAVDASTSDPLVVVTVSWTDRKGDVQQVSLSSKLAFVSPGSAAELSYTPFEDFIEAPTGRAYLGEGSIGVGDEAWGDDDHGDGSRVYRDGDSDNLLLAVDDNVVLTLEDACTLLSDDGAGNTTYRCTDFVEISGRVYFHSSFSITDVQNIFVLASDAAFCARYTPQRVKDGTTIAAKYFEKLDPASDGEITIADLPTDDGLPYFEYTCYLGGGWYGNIGLIQRSVKSNDKVCVGDPDSESHNPFIEASRRSYRGMMWKGREDAGTLVLQDGEMVPIKATVGGEEIIKYYSWGIADASVLNDGTGDNHDFLMINSTKDCGAAITTPLSALRRNESSFFCFNKIGYAAVGLGYNRYRDYYDEDASTKTNLDRLPFDRDDNGTYENDDHWGFYDFCPYDPTNPPHFVHVVKGPLELSVAKSQDASGSYTGQLADAIVVNNGDPQCEVADFLFSVGASAFNTYKSSYTCYFYDPGVMQGQTLIPEGVTAPITCADANDTDAFTISSGEIAATEVKSSNANGDTLYCGMSVALNAFDLQNDSGGTVAVDGGAVTYDVLLNDFLPSGVGRADVTLMAASPSRNSGFNDGTEGSVAVIDGGSGYKVLEYTPGTYVGEVSISYTVGHSSYPSDSAALSYLVTSNTDPVAPDLLFNAASFEDVSVSISGDILSAVTDGDGPSVFVSVSKESATTTIIESTTELLYSAPAGPLLETYRYVVEDSGDIGTRGTANGLLTFMVAAPVSNDLVINLSGSDIAGVSVMAAAGEGSGSCANTSGASVQYTCTLPDNGDGWSGTITLTGKVKTNGNDNWVKICDPATSTMVVSYDINVSGLASSQSVSLKTPDGAVGDACTP